MLCVFHNTRILGLSLISVLKKKLFGICTPTANGHEMDVDTVRFDVIQKMQNVLGNVLQTTTVTRKEFTDGKLFTTADLISMTESPWIDLTVQTWPKPVDGQEYKFRMQYNLRGVVFNDPDVL